MSVSEEAQHIASALADAFRVGAAFDAMPRVRRYGDRDDKGAVDLLGCADSPEKGITAYGTIGLSDHARENAADLRVELVGAFPTARPGFADVMATCAFSMINDGAPLRPGVVHGDVIAMHDLSRTLRHVMFFSPFLWGDEPSSLVLADRTVAWLMAVPISEVERAYAAEAGPNALEELFARANINILDPDRPSVLGRV